MFGHHLHAAQFLLRTCLVWQEQGILGASRKPVWDKPNLLLRKRLICSAGTSNLMFV
jgi:hypothetical protein